jgi:hypothetical protein
MGGLGPKFSFFFFFLCKRPRRETTIDKWTSVTLRHPHTHIHHEDDFNRAGHFQASLQPGSTQSVLPRVLRMCACTLFSILHSLAVFYPSSDYNILPRP